ncbi:Branched-chain amino acid aminotransferase II [Penicillium expansum]|uniref:Branched-chain amino acid aminotransferase II n=1 Tax=Penicillium expansum TaxID=27334 RepID=A0A0A2J383_PENEN|nr:Branched-chain amino acid aminotransferase II [Penicillium expansum]KGO46855.1 Branched-chain amino acid aminotransferase II [Penicillium expansum]KGO62377.1 Branched-chain amino acid aminotransferase II [Penicillium expansum]
MAAVMPSTAYTPHPTKMMKAAQWMGTREVEVGIVPKPKITDPGDAIVQITHCTISGSDIHLYEGELKDAMEKGDILGQEAIGIVEEVGPDVKTLNSGDRVIILPVISCGTCSYCQRQEYSLCDNTNPSKEMEAAYGHRLSGKLGYSRLCGGYPGDQAEYCRVPHADLSCVRAPEHIDARKLLGLTNVVTTAWHALELADMQQGDVVGVWGCGPIGLATQRLAKLRGARKVYAMDKDPQRLRIAEDFGMTPVDVDAHPDVAEYILSIQDHGLDRSIEASGFRSSPKTEYPAMRAIGLEKDSSDTLSAMIKATRKGGNLALVGDFFFMTHDFPIGPLMQKALTVRGGQTWPQKVNCFFFFFRFELIAYQVQYYPFLMDLVVQGKLDTAWMFTYVDEFENIADMYQKFSQHEVPGKLKPWPPAGISISTLLHQFFMFPPPPIALDWNNLGFKVRDGNGHVEIHFSNSGENKWSAPQFVASPFLPIHGMAPGLNYGQQVYEGLKAFRHPANDKITIFRPDRNAKRMQYSAEVVSIPPVPKDLFIECVRLAVGANAEYVPPHDSGAAMYVRPMLFGSSAQLGLSPPDGYTLAVFAMPTGVYHGATAVEALILEDFDRCAPHGTGAAKVGGNYAPVLRHSDRARREGFGITLHLDSATRSEVDEFSTSAFIGVKRDGDQITVIQPDSQNAIDSVTAASVLEIARTLGYRVEKRRVAYEELREFDEVIAAGTAAALVPVGSITMQSRGDKFEYRCGAQKEGGEVCVKLLQTLRGIQSGTIEDTFGWNYEVQAPPKGWTQQEQEEIELSGANVP